ncbi:MAG TPA: hypothetical protein P5081_05655 [Phycisphaerae bacterium]|nr:hypothetical protein [Phycisphaerae bacterium]HRW52352.1 hypothetical protein [Phycisphaerae bacterium]
MNRYTSILNRFVVCLVAALSAGAVAQTAPLASTEVATPFDSGWIENTGAEAKVIWSQRVEVVGAPWMRLRFGDVHLGRGGSAVRLRVTSALDGYTQLLNSRSAGEWRNTSAYFNGGAVDVEIIAEPASGPCRVTVDGATVGVQAAGTRNICDGADDRLPSTDPRAARVVPVGCTAWLINDANFCQLTAGHCVVSSNADVLEFNVPPSSSTGAIVHPPPSDQYAVDPASLQYTPDGAIEVGEDWAYFGVFDNSTTGLTPYESQGDRYALADSVPAPMGQILRKTGFGSTDSTVPPSYNLAQKTLTGPFTNQIGTWLHYPIDSSGGDSGSPVFFDGSDIAIAIHTNGGCAQSGYNSGTSIENVDLQAALANPIGVCVPNYFEYDFPNGRPMLVGGSGGETTRVNVMGRNFYEVAPGSGVLHYNYGDGWLTAPLQDVSANEFDIAFPSMPCARSVDYYLTFATTTGAVSSSPFGAPSTTYSTLSGASVTILSAFDFESAGGWFVTNQTLQSGAWTLGTPTGAGLFGAPVSDYDGSGQCYLTGTLSESDDVDGGPTRLWSPAVNFSTTENPVIQYARWFTNSNQDEDRLLVELANNSAVNFVDFESVADSVGWSQRNVLLNDVFADPGTVRIRFSAADNPNNSRTEAAIDAVLFLDIGCGTSCVKGDVNLDGQVNGRDVEPFTAAILNPPAPGTDEFCAADMNSDDVVTTAGDLAAFASCLLAGGCP